jgi:hypothetical protein
MDSAVRTMQQHLDSCVFVYSSTYITRAVSLCCCLHELHVV